jgi:pentatricopeptide repeat protein
VTGVTVTPGAPQERLPIQISVSMLSTSKAAITAAFQRTAQRNLRLLSSEVSFGNEPLFPQQKRGPWSHATGSSPVNQGIFLDVHNTKLGKSAADGMIVRSLEQAIKIKKSGRAPTVETYNHLLRACAAAGLPNEARALLADMVLMKLKPTNETFSQIMNVSLLLTRTLCNNESSQNVSATPALYTEFLT